MKDIEDNEKYIDVDDGNSKKILLIVGILLMIIVIIVLLLSCDKNSNKKSTNNYLGYVKVNNGELLPNFSREVLNYEVTATSSTLTISCAGESSKSTTEGCNKTINIIDVGTKIIHVIKVTAEDKSIKEYTFNIKKKIDVEEPIVLDEVKVILTGTVKSGEETKTDVKLTTSVTPTTNEYTYKWYKDGKVIEKEEKNTYTAKISGEYYTEVTNKKDNKTVKSNVYEVNIVKEVVKPDPGNTYTLKITSVSGNPSSWSKSATLKVNVTASNGISKYSFDGGKTWQDSSTKTITKNQTVNIKVKDKKNNITSKTVIVSKVDATKPTVKINESKRTDTEVTLDASISPKTTLSGYKYQWYSNGNIISGATKLNYIAKQNGIYSIRITTGAGIVVKSAEYTVNFKSKLSCPEISATDLNKKPLAPETTVMNGMIMKIVPTSTTLNYDIYVNVEDSLKDFEYYATSIVPMYVTLKESGKRVVKMVLHDNSGNTLSCYSKIYYIK